MVDLAKHVKRFVRGTQEAKLARYQSLLPKIASYELALQRLSEHELRKLSLSLRYRAKSQEPLSRLLPEAYALVREAARRTVGMRHFDVQLLGGIAMHHRSIVEMQTGEGKTLTATLPIYLNALTGRGAHLATSNPYLARRDAEEMGPIYTMLGLSVGIIEPGMSVVERRKAYAADITYGTGSEFGFDFLKDRLLLRQVKEGLADFLSEMLGARAAAPVEPLQRETHFVVVDEADSVLIDAANTPMIISAAVAAKEDVRACYLWSARVAELFEQDQHYLFNAKKKSVELTAAGRRLVRTLPKPPALDAVGIFPLYEYVERAVRVKRVFFREQQYVVRNDKIVIIHEYSGRPTEGVKWSYGIHQAVEAKEGVTVTEETGFSARITVQDFFLRYHRLTGMTGTAMSSAQEFRKVYKAGVLQVPTNRPPKRTQWPDRIFNTRVEKWAAIVEEVREVRAQGRPVLIGTRSIDKSLELSALLADAGVEHQVLNAYEVAAEAKIVACAGEAGKITVSTNLAGRGTDIKLGEGVAALGGLHVILTEMHEAGRIDRQLIGRCGRQGDPGTFRRYLALDDDILVAGLGPEKAEALKSLGGEDAGSFDFAGWLFAKSQRLVERRQFQERQVLMNSEKERRKSKTQMGQDPTLD